MRIPAYIKFFYVAYDKLKAIGQVGILYQFRRKYANNFSDDIKKFEKDVKKILTNYLVAINDTTNVAKRRCGKAIKKRKKFTMS
jgi:hypothetical protein